MREWEDNFRKVLFLEKSVEDVLTSLKDNGIGFGFGFRFGYKNISVLVQINLLRMSINHEM